MPRESLKSKQERAIRIFDILNAKYPDVGTFLDHKNAYELLIAVILSAQCTDVRVNIVTPSLFEKYPTPKDLAQAEVDEIAEVIRSINFFNNKAKNIQKTAQILVETYKSEVPETLDELVGLPGVGRKTANVVLGQAFNVPGITVDTHVKRLTTRWGFTKHKDAVRAEKDIMKIWPESTWIDFSSITILQGRDVCKAQKPLCHDCELATVCPSFPL